MNKIVLFLLTVLSGSIPAGAQHWQQRVNYSIDVTLTDSTHALDGNVRMDYINHSPDTLSFIWIRCWANAFKNDRTAFSESLIRKGRTDFYFSDKDRKGYINRLEFRADGQLARMEDHPQYLDVIRVVLPHPLAPGDSVELRTPFHVQLSDNFSGNGYHQGVYHVTQWYPKAAVYDESGWHPDPFLDGVGSYGEFGDFDVLVHVPTNLVVVGPVQPDASGHYHQSDIPDFVWFASPRFRMKHDTMQLASGRVIGLYSYSIRPNGPIARNGREFLKVAIRYYSNLLGEYPFDQATLVETRNAFHSAGGSDPAPFAYPGIIAVDGGDTIYYHLKRTIEREIGDNWLSIAIGADGRRYPWMTAGILQYYDDRFRQEYNYRRKFPLPDRRAAINTRVVLHDDQPISTSAEAFTPRNYDLIGCVKTSIWLLDLERRLGRNLFDSCMQDYFRRQEFHHPGPRDLKEIFQRTNQPIDSAFALLSTTGPVQPIPFGRPLHPFFDLWPTNMNSLNISPAIGANNYDGMVGLLIHNYNRPPQHWQLLAAPLYGIHGQQLDGLGHLNYAWYPHRSFRLIEAGINGGRFPTLKGTDSNSHTIYGGFYKVAPYVRLFLPGSTSTSTMESWIEWKTYSIGEKGFDNYVLKSTDSLYYPVAGKYHFRYLNQLTFGVRDERVLYPYAVNFQVQQAASWYRFNLDLRYFLNYASTGGLAVRLFGAKFGYLGTRNPAADLTAYEPKLTAVRGSEDYTYGNYFIGRNDFNGLASHQVMLRDGDLKLRTDLFQGLQGRSDNWVAAVNLNSTLPAQIVPDWLPLHLFFDIGTYAQAWADNPPTSHFLYDAGFELDLFHEVLRIYAPVLYSSDFSSQLKTVPGQSGFFQTISFSIDAQNIPFRKWFGYTPF